MGDPISRRTLGAAIVGGALTAAAVAQGQDQAQKPPEGLPQPPDDTRDYPAPNFKPTLRRPRLGHTLVQDFVIYAHGDLDMVKLLLDKYPAVLNATVDWGGGDFESAMGGASHMGRRDIVAYLIEKGARPDIFTYAMLGHLEIVKSLIASHPTLADAKGPHGIPLIVHAKQGGKEAEEVLRYLESLKKPAAP
jgi:hypothetical protein